jgi:hypothetical protein
MKIELRTITPEEADRLRCTYPLVDMVDIKDIERDRSLWWLAYYEEEGCVDEIQQHKSQQYADLIAGLTEGDPRYGNTVCLDQAGVVRNVEGLEHLAYIVYYQNPTELYLCTVDDVPMRRPGPPQQ